MMQLGLISRFTLMTVAVADVLAVAGLVIALSGVVVRLRKAEKLVEKIRELLYGDLATR